MTPVIPKLTVNFVKQNVGRPIFASLGAGVTYNLSTCGRYVRFTLDPYKGMLVYARNDYDVGVAGRGGSAPGAFSSPSDIDAALDHTLVIADTGNDRLFFMGWHDRVIFTGNLCSWEAGTASIGLVYYGSIGHAEGFDFTHPMGVSMDDAGTPTVASDDVVWVADTGNHRIVKLRPGLPNGTRQDLGSYGTFGSGMGQFSAPRRVVRGRMTTGGDPSTTRNNEFLYVLDSGNNRIVRLRCSGVANSAEWLSAVVPPMAENALLESIACDAWGNVYVTDSRNNKILKYSATLELLEAYGSFGTGTQNGELLHPVDFRPHFDQFYSSSEPVLNHVIGTNKATLTERWDEESGAQGYMLGVGVEGLAARGSDSPPGTWLRFTLTDHAYASIQVTDTLGIVVKTLDTGVAFRASGTDSVFWNGTRNDGSLVQRCIKYRCRIIPRSGYSTMFDSLQAKTIEFNYNPRIPLTYRLIANPPGAQVIENGTVVLVPGAGYAVPCTTCTASAVRTLSTPPNQTLGNTRYCFDFWGNGAPRSHTVSLSSDSTITLNLVASGSGPTSAGAGFYYDDFFDCKSPYLFAGSIVARTSVPGDTFRVWGPVTFGFPPGGYSALTIEAPFIANGARFGVYDSTATTPGQWQGIQLSSEASLFLDGCTVRNAKDGIRTYVFGVPTKVSNVSVKHSTFTLNLQRDVWVAFPWTWSTATFIGNTFFNGRGLQLDLESESVTPIGTATIQDNYFRSAVQSVPELDIRGAWQGDVRGNTFTVNQQGATGISLNQYGTYGSPSVVINYNTFTIAKGGTPPRIALKTATGPVRQIDARCNRWGTYTNTTDIDELIVDCATGDCGSNPLVPAEALYLPWLTNSGCDGSNTSGGGGPGGGGCPFVLSRTDGGYVVENSILGRSEVDGTMVEDACPLRVSEVGQGGTVHLRIAELESDTDVIDRIGLGAVEVPNGYELSTDDAGRPILVQWPDAPTEELARSSKITAFISPVAPGSAYAGSQGDSLELLVPDSPGTTPGKRRIGINMIPKPPEASTQPGATGVIIRASREREGDRWVTIGSLLPREHWSTETIGLGALDGGIIRRLRLVWQSQHTLGRIGLVNTAEAKVSAVPAVSARHSGGEDVSAAVQRQDWQTVKLRPGEHIDLAYDVSRVPSTSKLVLLAHGRYFPPGVEPTPEVPAAYFLGQNRPNPFNPTTTIEFGVPSPGKVSIRIFDVSGRLVQILVDRELPAGFHQADWDGRARSGISASSGIYFYELRSGSFVQKRRMVLIR